MSGMRPSDLTEWAKEEVLQAVMDRFDALRSDPVNGFADVDEEAAFKRQVDRVAAFLAPRGRRSTSR